MRARAEAAKATETGVLDAAIELFTESAYEDVSLERVARAAGVTKRTVIRRFGTKEELFTSAMARGRDEGMPQRDAAPVDDVPGAVRNVVEHYERWGKNRLRMISQEDRIPVVREDVEIGRHFHRRWVESTFHSLLAGATGAHRKRRIYGLLALTDVYTWKLLRLDHGLSRAETERTLIELINSLEGEA
ncbi:MAG: TetR/AcrR family transcriptional regulator [Actinomycetota bacterium]|nr:TetR/AcrR family transcriptional regulator [Actinomycetota bacterium]